jgi:heme exporter protein CcmB
MSRSNYPMIISNKKAFLIVLLHSLNLFYTNKATLLNSFAFYLITIVVFHIAVGPYELSPLVSNGIIIIGIIFSLMLSANLLLKNDHDKGILEQWLIQPFALEIVLLAKAVCFIIIFTLAYTLLMPVSFLLYNLSFEYLWITLVIGFLTMTIITVVLLFGEALALHSNSSVLSFVLIMPLLIPVLVAATLSIQNQVYLWLLFSLALISSVIFIFSTKYLLKIQAS